MRRLFWRNAHRKGRSALYKVGDKVVYPHHGAGTVVKKESREVLGQKREYLTIKILHNDMTVQVPCENADQVGLRRVIGEKEVGVVLKALTGGSTEMPKNWNRRFKHNRDKMKTDRKSTRLNSSHVSISYAVFCLKKKKYEQSHRAHELF